MRWSGGNLHRLPMGLGGGDLLFCHTGRVSVLRRDFRWAAHLVAHSRCHFRSAWRRGSIVPVGPGESSPSSCSCCSRSLYRGENVRNRRRWSAEARAICRLPRFYYRHTIQTLCRRSTEVFKSARFSSGHAARSRGAFPCGLAGVRRACRVAAEAEKLAEIAAPRRARSRVDCHLRILLGAHRLSLTPSSKMNSASCPAFTA